MAPRISIRNQAGDLRTVADAALPQGRSAKRGIFPWKVVHACDSARSISSIIDVQATAGMRPYVVTALGASVAPKSLMQSWTEVRRWRTEFDGAPPVDVLHAHTFASGMAAVRGNNAVVYDLHGFVENLGECTPSSWLGRSFRAAEQFVLSRAGSLIVHSSAMKLDCQARGVEAQHIFVVPSPLPESGPADHEWLKNNFGFLRQTQVTADHSAVPAPEGAITFYAEVPSGSWVELQTLLTGFALLHRECEHVRFFLSAPDELARKVMQNAQELEIADVAFMLTAQDAPRALASADVVISTGESQTIAVQALLHSRCLLAADTSHNRDVTAQGRGSVWYKPAIEKTSARDFAQRAAFLARNPDFRAALALSGHRHLVDSRSPERLARHYHQAYKHAVSRGRTGSVEETNAPSLLPLPSAG